MMLRILLLALGLMLPTLAQAATYDLVVERTAMQVVPGRSDSVIAINGSVPGPTLRFKEGEEAIVRVTNRLKASTSIHWHGLLIDGAYDGAPGFNGFNGIAPGETYTYRIRVRQSGTYWYHAHSEGQEQAGQYGALIIAPAGEDPIKADAEHVILLSDHTREDPARVLRNLKSDSGYYNWNKRTLPELMRDAKKFGMKATMAERAAWGDMRMDATDIADVTGYALLMHGRPTAAGPTLAFQPGQRVRLRFINGSAMSFMDIRIPGVPMTIVAADGRPVQPVTVDEFRMGVAETYDVIVEPPAGAHAVWVETLDRRASVLGRLTSDPALRVSAPPPRPKQVLMLAEMGHSMPAPGEACTAEHAAMGHCQLAGVTPAAVDPNCPAEHAAMGHCTPKAPAAAPADPDCPAEHAAMGHCTPKAPIVAAATDPDCPPEHAAMGHCTPRAAGPRAGTAVALVEKPDGGTPFPVVDYGYGKDPMAGMDHSKMKGMMAMPVLGKEGDTDGSGRVFGWATGAPYGARVLSMRDLVALQPKADAAAPTREIIVRLQGNMERYIWTLNGKKFGEGPPIDVKYGERVRVTFINETMMAHPMHLHGMFFEVENGQAPGLMPEKNVIVVAPGRTQSIILTANEAGEWPLHCHLLYHMNSGMMQKLVVANVASPDGKPVPAAVHHH
ncbi:multicopper oxidase domain-containing protein [Sandarakinorhabdus sp.]|jgi:CopA family copper-resistance protein|uniref:multicopper oxidase domain-containing protein n=1 Tax=Sandarakinorhabdus sp. TaxID=1916663 RepID=UPI0028AFB131|nr:multicopper oxidase domain-containing protein [Sandarakinorhabdus sp.]